MKSLKLRMTLRIIAIAMGVSLAVSVARGNDILDIGELDEQFFVRFNGVPQSFTETTGTEGSLIELPSGFFIDNFPGVAILGEPETFCSICGGVNASNSISLASFNTILWTSDVPLIGGYQLLPFFETEFDAGIGPRGGRFDLRLGDAVTPPPPLPDSGTTAMLLGSALGGLGLLRRFVRR
jgi:protein with PEP-CTERM/exosortase system signal